MEPSVEKTCCRCHEKMIISMGNLNDKSYLKYKNQYYHTKCFIEYANERVMRNNRYSLNWQMALDNMEQYQKEAYDSISISIDRDALNKYLIKHYNVISISKYFWTMITEIGNGKYKGETCKPVSLREFLEMWQYAQKKLDKINNKNRMSGKDIDGEDRIQYDLAIIIKKYASITKGIAKKKASEAENKEAAKQAANYAREFTLDSNRIKKTKFEQKVDLSELFD